MNGCGERIVRLYKCQFKRPRFIYNNGTCSNSYDSLFHWHKEALQSLGSIRQKIELFIHLNSIKYENGKEKKENSMDMLVKAYTT